MKVKLFSLLFFVFFSVIAFSQQSRKIKVLDVATINCYYLFTRQVNAAENIFRSDTMLLQIGEKFSKFYDPARLGRDSILAAVIPDQEDIKQMEITSNAESTGISKLTGTVASKTNEGESYQLFKDKSTNKIRVLDYTNPLFGVRYQYEDDPGTFAWKVADELDTIQSYLCQKATLNFRGRVYIAWFASDIPVNDGPWKFQGLPGLILKVEDSEKMFSFDLIGLNQLITPEPITIDDSKNIKCTRQQFEKLLNGKVSSYQVNFSRGILTVNTGKIAVPILMERE